MDALITAIEDAGQPHYMGWAKHVPHVGRYSYDVVIAVQQQTLPKIISDRWRQNARAADKSWLFKIVADHVARHVDDLPEIQEQVRLMQWLLTMPRQKIEQAVHEVFTFVKEDYGHAFLILRENGHPVAVLRDATAVGFYPKHLACHLVDGRRVYLEDIGKMARAAKMIKFDEVYPGALSDDRDARVTSCAVFPLTHRQFYDAPHVLRECVFNQPYHSFAEKTVNGKPTLNCVVTANHFVQRLNVELPQEFLDATMPDHTAAAIEKYAAHPADNFMCVGNVTMKGRNKLLGPKKPPTATWQLTKPLVDPAIAAAGVVVRQVSRVAGLAVS